MSKFSLITVSKEKNGIVEGYWIQDHIGTIESATTLSDETSKINGNSNIAVIDQINSTVPMLGYWENRTKLN